MTTPASYTCPYCRIPSDGGGAACPHCGAPVDVRLTDLVGQPPPPADGFAANVPTEVHVAIASHWGGHAPPSGLVSGFGPDAAARVMAAYASSGLQERRRVERGGWVIVELGRS